MPWSLGLRLILHGEGELHGQPAEPVSAKFTLRRAAQRLFAVQGTLLCPALGPLRAASGSWRFPDVFELDLGDGWSAACELDAAAPRSLLGQSLWAGPLLHAGQPRGALRLRFDLRHDWPSLVRSLHVRDGLC